MSKYYKFPKSATNHVPPVLSYPDASIADASAEELPMVGKADQRAAYHALEDFYYEVPDFFEVADVLSFATMSGVDADVNLLVEISADAVPASVRKRLPSGE